MNAGPHTSVGLPLACLGRTPGGGLILAAGIVGVLMPFRGGAPISSGLGACTDGNGFPCIGDGVPAMRMASRPSKDPPAPFPHKTERVKAASAAR
mmetsp:Transcript_69555/g.225070  ORF Transcript_69555/g.225070 Transcript_69555/m.225070 type:complete len:95 (+) Transcript_69555:158-442(+)